MKITKTKESPFGGLWVWGSTEDGYLFTAKVFDRPRKDGIETAEHETGGNVTSLSIRSGKRDCFSFESGKLMSSTEEGEDVMYEIVSDLEVMFCR